MFRLFGTLLFCAITLFFAGSSIGSSSVEGAVQKRIGMFKSSGANIKKLSKLIRTGDINASVELVDFHVHVTVVFKTLYKNFTGSFKSLLKRRWDFDAVLASHFKCNNCLN